MRRIVDFAIDHARLTIAILIFLLIAGGLAYVNIPKEAEPDVTVPIIYVQLSQAGISPRNCKVGTNLWAGMAICPANHTPNVKLVFFDSSWGQPDGRLPPASELARGQLQRIVWTPPG